LIQERNAALPPWERGEYNDRSSTISRPIKSN
jgi:hypothetical protein